MLKILFFGTGDFAVKPLEALSEYKVTLITKKDMPGKRGKGLIPTKAKTFAEKNGIPFYTPDNLKDFDFTKIEKPDVIVTASYGKILSKELLDFAKIIAVNIHGSLLPKYRGAAPVQRAILDGSKETGVTLMRMDEGLDTGDIILNPKGQKFQESINIENLYSGEVFEKLSEIGKELLLKLLKEIDGIEFEKQNDAEATYAKPIKKEEGFLDFKDDPIVLYRKVLALSENPGTYFIKNEIRYKVTKAEIENGKFVIKRIIPPGKKEMSFEDFLRGNPKFLL